MRIPVYPDLPPSHLAHFFLIVVNINFSFLIRLNMACGSCGSGSTPGGCKSHGSCASGSCNRMNVHDWLANLPFSDPESGCRVVEVSFNNGSRKDFFKNTTTYFFEKGDMITVEGVSGYDVGSVNMT